MDSKRTIWTVVGGAAVLTGYGAVKHQRNPTRQLIGIGAAGVILLFLAEPAPKFASGLAVLMGISLTLNYDYSGTVTTSVGGGGGATGTVK